MDYDSQTMANSDGVSVHSGFPNPAIDRRGQDQHLALDLNRLLIRHPSSTYLFRVSGHLWADQGIYDGDIAVIDRAVTPRTTDLALSWSGDGFNLERYAHHRSEEQPWGIVTAVIRQHR